MVSSSGNVEKGRGASAGRPHFIARAMRFALEKLYRELAWAYDGVSWLVSLGHWRSWTQEALRYVRGERVLEVGFGPGHLLGYLTRGGCRVWGCDLSPAMVRQAGRRLRRAGLAPLLCQARAQGLPFAPGSFDTVVCTFPAPYILDAGTWAEFRRVLAPAGRVVVVYGARLGGRSLGRRLARGLLSLGHVVGESPRWQQAVQAGVSLRHLVVDVDSDQVGLLLLETGDGTDAA